MKIIQKIFLIILSIVIVNSTFFINYSFAYNDFYDGNDIQFYSENSNGYSDCVGSGNSPLVGNDNLEKIIRFYTSKGLSLAQASGIAGNYKHESGFNPTAINSIGAYGIAQWLGGRKAQLLKLPNYNQLDVQLNFSWSELTGSESSSLAALKNTTTPEAAAWSFFNTYERAGDSSGSTRARYATNIYNIYKGIVPDNNNYSSSDIVCTGDGSPSQYINGFALYNQKDLRWVNYPYGSSTIGNSGCGPSAMAMIITALTSKSVTPVNTATFGTNNNLYEEGVGSRWTIAEKMSENWGLSAKNITSNVAVINNILRSGGLVVTSGSGASPFTPGGHYIVIRAVTSSGKWLVGDSNGQTGIKNSSIEWDPNYILGIANAGNIWAITK